MKNLTNFLKKKKSESPKNQLKSEVEKLNKLVLGNSQKGYIPELKARIFYLSSGRNALARDAQSLDIDVDSLEYLNAVYERLNGILSKTKYRKNPFLDMEDTEGVKENILILGLKGNSKTKKDLMGKEVLLRDHYKNLQLSFTALYAQFKIAERQYKQSLED